MKRIVLALATVALLAGTAAAQNPRVRRPLPTGPAAPAPVISLGELTPTPDMWMYLQERDDYLNPKLARRRRAEFKAWQRDKRMAARKWFGYSNARPPASHTPFTGEYSPAWRSNSFVPFNWRGAGHAPQTVLVPGAAYIR